MFPCTKCGACCRVAALLGLPPKEPGSAICAHLNEETNECGIYETRPDICRIDKFTEIAGITTEQSYKLNAEACNRMQEQQGIGREFRVVYEEDSNVDCDPADCDQPAPR